MQKVLYVSDLDGTLLNQDGIISQQSTQIINQLIQNGAKFTIATARAYSSAKKLTQNLMLTDPMIIYNGAFIIEHKSGKIISSNFFTPDEVEFLADLMAKHNLYPLVCSMQNNDERIAFLQNSLSPTTQKYYQLMLSHGDKRFYQCQTLKQLYSGNIFYFKFTGEYEDFYSFKQIVNQDPRFTAILSNPVYEYERYWFEIMPSSTSKAEGVKKLKQLGGYNKVICFGDAPNDVEMFKVANEGYAMQNACQNLKNIATATIGSNAKDGVAHHLNKIISGKKHSQEA